MLCFQHYVNIYNVKKTVLWNLKSFTDFVCLILMRKYVIGKYYYIYPVIGQYGKDPKLLNEIKTTSINNFNINLFIFLGCYQLGGKLLFFEIFH